MPRQLTISTAIAAAIFLAAPTPAQQTEKPEHAYGAPPDWQRYRELAEAAVKDLLVDPDSAKIEWPNGYRKGGFKPFMSKRVYGYATCGLVNSRNRMGGYAGQQPFAVVIDNDRVLYVEIARSRGNLIAEACDRASLPPVEEMASGSAPEANLDISLSAHPEGAYVAAVPAGSAGERAGLKVGMIVTDVNGIGLEEMRVSEILKLIGRSSGKLRLGMVGGTTVEVEKADLIKAGAVAGNTN